MGTERLLVGPGESGRTGAQTVPDQVLRLQKRNCLFLPAWRTVCVRKRRQKRRGLLPPAPSARGPPSRLLPVRDCRERVSRDSGIDRECVGGFDLCKLLLCARCMMSFSDFPRTAVLFRFSELDFALYIQSGGWSALKLCDFMGHNPKQI